MEERSEQNVMLYSRSKLEITGVCDVFEFSECNVELTLKDGCLGIEGKDLKIDYFSSDTGKVSIHGSVDALFYYSKGPLAKKKRKN